MVQGASSAHGPEAQLRTFRHIKSRVWGHGGQNWPSCTCPSVCVLRVYVSAQQMSGQGHMCEGVCDCMCMCVSVSDVGAGLHAHAPGARP